LQSYHGTHSGKAADKGHPGLEVSTSPPATANKISGRRPYIQKLKKSFSTPITDTIWIGSGIYIEKADRQGRG
jgi:hypothetical protein